LAKVRVTKAPSASVPKTPAEHISLQE